MVEDTGGGRLSTGGYWGVVNTGVRWQGVEQGRINCGILISGIRARGVSSEHMENMEMFSCSPIFRCALILRELNQIFISYLFKRGQEQSFFPSKTLINGISRDDSKNFNIRTCEHMILGQLKI